MPQTITPCRCGDAVWSAGGVVTLPLVACAAGDGACVCTVRATATVASRAKAAAAVRNLILRDIIFGYLESVAFRPEITKILLCTRQSVLTLNCSAALTGCWNIATPPTCIDSTACIAALQNENASSAGRYVTLTIAKGHSCPSTSAPRAARNIRRPRRRPLQASGVFCMEPCDQISNDRLLIAA